MPTRVLQSWRCAPADCTQPDTAWLTRCMASVQRWAARRGFDYVFEDDALFDRIPAALRQRTREQPVITADLARLAWLAASAGGGEAAIWLDADVLVIDPALLQAPPAAFSAGLEVWVEPRTDNRPGWRSRRKPHNAALVLRDPAEPTFAFYQHAAQTIVGKHAPGAMAPQIVGPKLLAALDSLLGGRGIPAWPQVGMLSPWVVQDLARGGGPALDQFRRDAPQPLAAVNLCASSIRSGALDAATMNRAIDALLAGALQATG